MTREGGLHVNDDVGHGGKLADNPPLHPVGDVVGVLDRDIRVHLYVHVEVDVMGGTPGPYAVAALYALDPLYYGFDGGGVYGEILGPVNEKLSLEFHGNVRLVE